MFALLTSLALAGVDDFEIARGIATEAVGSDEFPAAIGMAMAQCTPDVKGCSAVVVDLKSLDKRVRAEKPVQTVSDDAIADSGPPAAAPFDGVIYVDQPTGLEYVASLRPLPAPWRGLEVSNLSVSLPGVQKVCVRKEGIPIPIGQEVPFSGSHDKGAPVFSCPAAPAGYGSPIYVPEDSELLLAIFDATRQVYVVEKAWTCSRRANDYDRISRKTVTACVPSRVR